MASRCSETGMFSISSRITNEVPSENLRWSPRRSVDVDLEPSALDFRLWFNGDPEMS